MPNEPTNDQIQALLERINALETTNRDPHIIERAVPTDLVPYQGLFDILSDMQQGFFRSPLEETKMKVSQYLPSQSGQRASATFPRPECQAFSNHLTYMHIDWLKAKSHVKTIRVDNDCRDAGLTTVPIVDSNSYTTKSLLDSARILECTAMARSLQEATRRKKIFSKRREKLPILAPRIVQLRIPRYQTILKTTPLRILLPEVLVVVFPITLHLLVKILIVRIFLLAIKTKDRRRSTTRLPEDWQKLTDNKWINNIIKKGYRIPFQTQPPISNARQQPKNNSISPSHQTIEEKIRTLLVKRAIEDVHDWRPSSSSQPTSTESIHTSSSIQDGNYPESLSNNTTSRLPDQNRPTGRVSSHTGTPKFSQINWQGKLFQL
ncbi:unnamed protein product [Rhizopus stolonifer]